ncbi:hypothetical protein ACF06Q_26105 [Streptomyces leeuwenhoekii]|uniref:hypothetical protein n=1 Tax=Streptomyces leeuwenhoekii TaxID=1437453 RepID=UPI0036FD2569
MIAPSCLIVPLETGALAVNRDSPKLRRFTPQFEGRKSRVDPEPHKVTDEVDASQYGAHVHWQLPQALTRGRADLRRAGAPGPQQTSGPNEGAVRFPLAPNRWLVIRHHTTSSKNTTVAGWIVESDHLSRTTGTSPYLDESGTFTYIGRSLPLTDEPWSDTPPRSPFLTVAGCGIPAFAAFQPYCENVFSLHDPLTNGEQPLGEGRVSYLVAGWHSPADIDLLAAAPLEELRRFHALEDDEGAGLPAALRLMHWHLERGSPEHIPLPHRCLYVATVLDLPWHPTKADHWTSDRPTPGQLTVAVGHSVADARTALATDRGGIRGQRLAQAFEAGVLDAVDDDLDPAADGVTDSAHATWFSSAPAGYTWTITDRPGSDPPQPPGPAERAALHRLNADQWAFDQALRRLAALRERLYELWWARDPDRTVWEPPEDSDLTRRADKHLNPEAAGSLAHDVKSLITQCWGSSKQDQGLRGRIPYGDTPEELAAAIAAYEKKIGLSPQRTLTRVPLPPYHQPHDPVVILAGPGCRLTPPRDTSLACRTPEDIITRCLLDGQELRPPPDVPVPRGHGYRTVAAALAWAPLDALLGEFWLLQRVAERVRAAMGDRKQVPSTFRKDLTGPHPPLKAVPYGMEGQVSWPEHAGCWRQPWEPLFMLWSTQTWPLPYQDDSAPGRRHWAFDGREHHWLKTGHTRGHAAHGRWLLTAAPPFLVGGRVQEYLDRHPDTPVRDELLALAEGPDTSRQISQHLYGANGVIAARVPGTPLDPVAARHAGLLVRQTLVPDPTRAASGIPVRAAQFAFTALTVVDRFGSTVEVVNSGNDKRISLRRAHSVTPGKNAVVSEDTPERFLQLPPRLQQSARPLIEWISHRDDHRALQPGETPDLGPATPVCAWLVPRPAQNGVHFYDAAGRPLGELLVAGPDDAPFLEWVPLPGSHIRTLQQLYEPEFTANHPHLAPFVQALADPTDGTAAAAHRLGDLLDCVERAWTTITPHAPHQDPSTGVLAGRPIALARVRLRLELAAPPLPAATFEALTTHPADSAGHPAAALDWPVRLGDRDRRTDGLIGYYRAALPVPDTSTAYRHLYTSHLPDPPRTPYLTRIDPTTDPRVRAAEPPGQPPHAGPLLPSGTAAWLTVLCDPYAALHARTGILPLADTRLPEPYIRGPLANLAVCLATGPLLAPVHNPRGARGPGVALPTPNTRAGTWTWDERTTTDAGWATWPLAGLSEAAHPPDTPPPARTGYLRLTPTGPHTEPAGDPRKPREPGTVPPEPEATP